MKRLYLGILLWLCAHVALAAVTMENLYHVEVPLKDHSLLEQQAAMNQGLSQILTKLSGSRINDETFNVQNPEQYVKSFTVNPISQDLQNATANGESDNATSCCMISIDFDESAVQTLLKSKQTGLSKWSMKRPEIFMWLVERADTTGMNYEWLSPEQQSLAEQWVQRWSQERGVPTALQSKRSILGINLISPNVIGLGDGSRLDRLWKFGKTKPDILLLGDVYQNDEGCWVRLRWRGRHESFNHQTLGRGKDFEQALSQAYQQGIDQLSERKTAQLPESSPERLALEQENTSSLEKSLKQQLEVDLTQISGSNQYDQAMRYLKMVQGVKGVRVLAFLPPDRVRLAVDLSGDTLEFLKQLQEEHHFAFAEGSEPGNEFARDLRYVLQWQG